MQRLHRAAHAAQPAMRFHFIYRLHFVATLLYQSTVSKGSALPPPHGDFALPARERASPPTEVRPSPNGGFHFPQRNPVDFGRDGRGRRKQRQERKRKMTVKFITMKRAGNIASAPFYRGFVQHERTMSRCEAYEYCAERPGYKAPRSAQCSWHSP